MIPLHASKGADINKKIQTFFVHINFLLVYLSCFFLPFTSSFTTNAETPTGRLLHLFALQSTSRSHSVKRFIIYRVAAARL